jgi:hypothetical protein
MVYTDEYFGYNRLGKKGYTHRRIKHHARVYVDGDVHTQTIDGFFGLFKSGVRGAHHAVSHKWLQGYLNEWTWRYNAARTGTGCSTTSSKPPLSASTDCLTDRPW